MQLDSKKRSSDGVEVRRWVELIKDLGQKLGRKACPVKHLIAQAKTKAKKQFIARRRTLLSTPTSFIHFRNCKCSIVMEGQWKLEHDITDKAPVPAYWIV